MSATASPDQQSTENAVVVVNGQEKAIASRVITWDQVVDLAFPSERTDANLTFIVTYEDADERKDDGTLAAGGSVRVEEKDTVFYVARHRRS